MKPQRERVAMPATPMRIVSRSTDDGVSLSSRDTSTDTEQVEPVAVFCRIRPINNENHVCLEVVDERTVRERPPSGSRNQLLGRASEFTFGSVFDAGSGQEDVFMATGLPLVRGLLRGQNGLLFTYGVTGSGKTYTMQGQNSNPDEAGVLPRSLDVVFNSVGHRLVHSKFMIRPGMANDFEVHSLASAFKMLSEERIQNVRANRNNGYNTRSNSSDQSLLGRRGDVTRIEDIDDKGCVYAVFISYVEIYNKYIYDLLDTSEEGGSKKPKFTPKPTKEDMFGSIYVQATEVEVRNATEALEVFQRGQKRRRNAETLLNHDSSRSHVVFNIRIVKAKLMDEHEVDPKQPIVVSQLSLVDLAGSERTSRTGNTGGRLREAGNINNSLMNLRKCFELLRERQASGKSKKDIGILTRSDKLTYLLRDFFLGKGTVKMVVCVNPSIGDYEETLNVLQFAEMAQEIEIEVGINNLRTLARLEPETPARQRVREAFDNAIMRNKTNVDITKLNPNFNPIYSLGPPWPTGWQDNFDDDDALDALLRYIDQRIATRNTLKEALKTEEDGMRQRVVDVDQEAVMYKDEHKKVKNSLDIERRKVRELERRLVNSEAANNSLQRKVDAYCEAKVVLENELDEKELEMNKQQRKAEKTAMRLRSQLSNELGKRGHEEDNDEDKEPKGVGSRIADFEARGTNVGSTKRVRH